MRAPRLSFGEGQRGAALVEFPLFLGFFLLPLTFIVLTVPTWLQGAQAANDAAAEAGRAYVLSNGDPGSVDLAIRAVEISHNLEPGAISVVERPAEAVRSESVELRVSIELQAVALTDLGSFTYTTSFVERYPTFVRDPG